MEDPILKVSSIDVQQLKNSVEELSRELHTTKAEQDKQIRNTRWLAASVALDIVLSIAIGVGGYLIDRSQDQISVIQRAQEAETDLNRNNQCVLANMLLRFEKTSLSSTTITEAERQQRIDSYKDVHSIHDSLRCPIA